MVCRRSSGEVGFSSRIKEFSHLLNPVWSCAIPSLTWANVHVIWSGNINNVLATHVVSPPCLKGFSLWLEILWNPLVKEAWASSAKLLFWWQCCCFSFLSEEAELCIIEKLAFLSPVEGKEAVMGRGPAELLFESFIVGLYLFLYWDLFCISVV